MIFSALLILLFLFPWTCSANGQDFMISDGILVKYTGMDHNVVIPEGVKHYRQ